MEEKKETIDIFEKSKNKIFFFPLIRGEDRTKHNRRTEKSSTVFNSSARYFPIVSDQFAHPRPCRVLYRPGFRTVRRFPGTLIILSSIQTF